MKDYKIKYIKYKNKYLLLKNQIAGSYFEISNIDKLELGNTYIYKKNIIMLTFIEIKLINNETKKTNIVNEFDDEFNILISFKIGDIIDLNSKKYTLLDIIYSFEDLNENKIKISQKNINELKQFNFEYIDLTKLEDIKSKQPIVKNSLNYLEDQGLMQKINKLSEQFMGPFFNPLVGTNYIRMLTSTIQSNNFSSLYDFKNGELCLKKNRDRIINYINIFNQLCEISENGQYLFPKVKGEFYLFRFEYISNYDFLIKEITRREKIYYCPFSTTYNFDLNWAGANVLYVYKIPENCNYFYLSDQSQYEVTLQQGKVNIINIYYYYYINRRIIIILCDFIPISSSDIIRILPKNC